MNQAALLLQAAIGKTADIETVWPPTAKDLSIEECLKFVPVLLFNFVSIMTGHVYKEGIQRKILSIAQDLVHVSTSGATTTPKSLMSGLSL